MYKQMYNCDACDETFSYGDSLIRHKKLFCKRQKSENNTFKDKVKSNIIKKNEKTRLSYTPYNNLKYY